jgi:hypothetical protein
MIRRKSIQTTSMGMAVAAVVVSLSIALLLAGCARPRKTQLATDPATLDDMTFQAYLADIPVVTVDEVCRAMLILSDGEDTSENWEQRREVLLQRDLIREAWRLEPNNLADRGTIAFMVCKLCRIKGGVNALLFGSIGLGDRRYAFRELVYRGVIPPGNYWQTMTGAELVSLLGKADEFMEKKGLYETESLDIGSEEDLLATPTSQPQ